MPAESVSTKKLSEFLDLTDRHIQRLAREEVLPKAKRGKYPFRESVNAYINYLRERMQSNSGSYGDHKARLTKAQADLAELELSKKLEEVAPVADFEKATSAMMAIIQTNMMKVPSRVSIRLLGETNEKKFEEVLREEITQALTVSAESEIEDDEE